MRSMHPVLLKQKRLQVASEGGTVEIWVSQFIRQRIPSSWRSHSKRTTTIRVQLEPWGDEQVAAGWTEMLSFSDLSDRHAQLWQLVTSIVVVLKPCVVRTGHTHSHIVQQHGCLLATFSVRYLPIYPMWWFWPFTFYLFNY